MTTLAHTAAAFAGVVLLVAGGAKMRERDDLARVLRDIGLPPGAGAVAAVVPWVEGVVALGLLTGVAAPVAVPLAASLAVVLLLVHLRIARGPGTPCRCFGALDVSDSAVVGLGRALALVVAVLLALPSSLGASFVAAVQVDALATGALLAVTLLVATTIVDRAIAFERWRPRRMTP
jgi:hypothetical protein